MPTPQEFVEKWPLYTRAEIINFNSPGSITRMCRQCKKETAWSRAASDGVTVNIDPSRTFQYAAYSCVLCGGDSLLVLYQRLDWKPQGPNSTNYAYQAVKKIGQEPAASIEIPADLSERLGATGEHYKKALVCRNANYGIGAVAYMRRVVEEKTDELIDVVIELAQTYGVDAKTLESLMMAKEQVRYEDKLKIASELIPPRSDRVALTRLGSYTSI